MDVRSNGGGERNRARYDLFASAYEGVTRLASLGRIEQLYEAIAGSLDLAGGATIVELGCGPASVTPWLLRAAGPGGTVIGVDLSERMIERAREKAAASGWENARFERADVLDFEPPPRVDAVVFCLSLSTMPDCERSLEKALSMLDPGGRLSIVDSIPERSRPIASAVIRLKAPIVGARPSRAPLEIARSRLEKLVVRHFFGGVYTLVAGRVA